jgi:hypothetical protein
MQVESLRDDIQKVAEGVIGLDAKISMHVLPRIQALEEERGRAG